MKILLSILLVESQILLASDVKPTFEIIKDSTQIKVSLYNTSQKYQKCDLDFTLGMMDENYFEKYETKVIYKDILIHGQKDVFLYFTVDDFISNDKNLIELGLVAFSEGTILEKTKEPLNCRSIPIIDDSILVRSIGQAIRHNQMDLALYQYDDLYDKGNFKYLDLRGSNFNFKNGKKLRHFNLNYIDMGQLTTLSMQPDSEGCNTVKWNSPKKVDSFI